MTGRGPSARRVAPRTPPLADQALEGLQARRRVAAYLRTYGLTSERRIAQLTDEIVRSCATAGDLPRAAMATAQERVERFVEKLMPDQPRLEPLWLRAFVSAHPELFLAEPEPVSRAVARFGDPRSGRLPRKHGRLEPQSLALPRLPRWIAGVGLPALVTTALSALLLRDLARDGLTPIDWVCAVGFALGFALPAFGLTTAIAGFLHKREAGDPARASRMPRPHGALPRTALLVPICNEPPDAVFAGVVAMWEDLARTASSGSFDIFVLSDSRHAQQAADEERALRRAHELTDPAAGIGVYYRRRAHNEGHKSGNLAEFLERFAQGYTYALVLDADSLMSGEAVVELVRRMEATPDVGLLQAGLQLRGASTPLAQSQQLVASVCGPMFMRGLEYWSDGVGNYYGHNAIVRVSAFMQACGLPKLPGPPPLGGHLLSHDFVEAALLCRAGWQVRIAWDVQASWEEMPQRMPEYVARDRRWCQGNLQHLGIVFAVGLRAMSRVHLLAGAASYLNGVALVAFLAAGAAITLTSGGSPLGGANAVLLLSATVVCLAVPRLLGLLDTAADAQARRRHGGTLRLAGSVLAEAAISCFAAPVLVCHQLRALAAIARGGQVVWKAAAPSQRAPSARDTFALEVPTMLCGALIGAGLSFTNAGLFLWLAPIWAPMALAGPLSLLLSSRAAGRGLRTLGLFATGADLDPAPVLVRAAALRVSLQSNAAERFRDIVLDPCLLSMHLAELNARQTDLVARPASSDASASRLSACARALELGPDALAPHERDLLLHDPTSLRLLHREGWRRWPLDSESPRTTPECARRKPCEAESVTRSDAKLVVDPRSEDSTYVCDDCAARAEGGL